MISTVKEETAEVRRILTNGLKDNIKEHIDDRFATMQESINEDLEELKINIYMLSTRNPLQT